MSKTDHQLPSLEDLIVHATANRHLLERVRDELVSINGVARRGAGARPIVNGQSIRLATSSGQLAGFSLRETSGAAPAVVRLLDGSDASGDILFTVALLAGASNHEWLLPHGLFYGAGLFVQVLTGTIEGAIFLGPVGSA